MPLPFLDYSSQPLTTVRQPVERIAAQVGRIPASMISSGVVSGEELLIDAELPVRASTAPMKQ